MFAAAVCGQDCDFIPSVSLQGGEQKTEKNYISPCGLCRLDSKAIPHRPPQPSHQNVLASIDNFIHNNCK